MDISLELIQNLIYLINKNYIRIGLPNANGFESDKRFIFKPILVNSILIIFFLKCISNLFIENLYISQIMADYSHDWDFGIQWKIFETSTAGFTLLIQLNSYKANYSPIFKTTELMFKRNEKNFINLNIFKTILLIVNSISLTYGSIYSTIIIYYSFRFNILGIFSIFWAIIYFIAIIYMVYVIAWKFIVFILYCILSKKILNNENNYLIETNKRSKIYTILSHLKYLNQIYVEIYYSNRVWNKFIALIMLYLIICLSVTSLQLYRGHLSGLQYILLYILMFIDLFGLTVFMQVISSTNTESERTYKILCNLFANKFSSSSKYKNILFIKLKVNI